VWVSPSKYGIPVTAPLADHRVLVTGGSRGIGRAVCRRAAQQGAQVIVAARDSAAVEDTLAVLDGNGHEGLTLDVAYHDAWVRAMREVDRGGALHGCVAAAGVLGPIGPIDIVDPAEFRRTLAVNVDGTFLALRHALPRLAASGCGAAVTFSGGGGTGPLPRYDAYAASKSAVVRLTENVAAVARARSVAVNAIAPGFVATEIHQGTLAAGPARAGTEYYERTERHLAEGDAGADVAAELVCFLLGAEGRRITGKLISAQWDPWRDPPFRARLADDPDLATLRRIDDQLFSRVGR